MNLPLETFITFRNMNTRYVPIETIEEPTSPLKPALPDPLAECHSCRSSITGQEQDDMFRDHGEEILFNEANDLAVQNQILLEVLEALDEVVPGIFDLKLLANHQYEANANAATAFVTASQTEFFKDALLSPEYLSAFAASRAGVKTDKGWRTAFMMAANTENAPQLYMAQQDMIEGFNDARVTTEALITHRNIEVRRSLDTPSIAMGLDRRQDFRSLKDHSAVRTTMQVWGKTPTGAEHPIPNPEGTKLVVPRRFLKGILPENKGTLTIPQITSEREIATFIRNFAFEIQLVLKGSTNPANIKSNLQRQNPLHTFGTPIHPIYTHPHPMYDRED
ncbi:MAG TPA: hypothetical protein PK398_00265 [Candidatus Gracilibacteria bacterium]|nr:hypothetical protein [Candidatus Gracilibacteria bacterium]